MLGLTASTSQLMEGRRRPNGVPERRSLVIISTMHLQYPADLAQNLRARIPHGILEVTPPDMMRESVPSLYRIH